MAKVIIVLEDKSTKNDVSVKLNFKLKLQPGHETAAQEMSVLILKYIKKELSA